MSESSENDQFQEPISLNFLFYANNSPKLEDIQLSVIYDKKTNNKTLTKASLPLKLQ